MTASGNAVTLKDGLRGEIIGAPQNGLTLLQLENGQEVQLPSNLLQTEADGGYSFPFRLSELEDGSVIVPVIEEAAIVGTQEVETGRVVVRRTVEEREETVDLPLMQQTASVERVLVNRLIDDGALPEARQEGDTMIVPVFEEILVVEKRLMLKEEIYIRTEKRETHDPQTVTLRRDEVSVERLPSQTSSAG